MYIKKAGISAGNPVEFEFDFEREDAVHEDGLNSLSPNDVLVNHLHQEDQEDGTGAWVGSEFDHGVTVCLSRSLFFLFSFFFSFFI